MLCLTYRGSLVTLGKPPCRATPNECSERYQKETGWQPGKTDKLDPTICDFLGVTVFEAQIQSGVARAVVAIFGQ